MSPAGGLRLQSPSPALPHSFAPSGDFALIQRGQEAGVLSPSLGRSQLAKATKVRPIPNWCANHSIIDQEFSYLSRDILQIVCPLPVTYYR